MRRVVFDFFSVCISNKLTWIVTKTPINFEEIVSSASISEQKNKLSRYLTIIDQTNLEKLKSEDRHDFIWGVQPYMKEIITKMIYDWEGSDQFWSDISWGFDINAYYSKKVYFIPNGIPSCFTLGDFLQVGFWEAAATSGGMLKFKKIPINNGEVTLPSIDKEFYTIHESITYVRSLYLKSGYEIQQVSNDRIESNEFVIGISETFEVLNFLYAKEDLAETLSLLQTNNIKYLVNKNKDFCFGNIISEGYDGKLASSIPDFDPLAIDFEINGNKGKANTRELMAMYENRLDLLHKNAKIEKDGIYSIANLIPKEDTPKLLYGNRLLDTFVSTSAGVESLREIYRHLLILTELIYEKGYIFDGGIKPVKYAINNKFELPYALNRIDTGSISFGNEIVPYSSKITPYKVPFDIASEFSVLKRDSNPLPNAGVKRLDFKDVQKETSAQIKNMLGKKTQLSENLRNIQNIVYNSINNGLPKFYDGLKVLPLGENEHIEYNDYSNDGLVDPNFDYNELQLKGDSQPLLMSSYSAPLRTSKAQLPSSKKQTNEKSTFKQIADYALPKLKDKAIEIAKQKFEKELEEFDGGAFIDKVKNKIMDIFKL